MIYPILYAYAKTHGLARESFLTDVSNVKWIMSVQGKRQFELRPCEGALVMKLPIQEKKAGKHAKPDFTHGRPGYVFGVDLSEKRDDEWTAECHKEFKALIALAAQETKDEALKEWANFFAHSGKRIGSYAQFSKRRVGALDVVVLADCRWRPLIERPKVLAWWNSHRAERDGQVCQDLVTGKKAVMARLHNLIRGFPGARATGATLVSFNQPSHESFVAQGANAPVSEEVMIAASKALERLVSRDSERCRSLTLPCREKDKSDSVTALFVVPDEKNEKTSQFMRSLLNPAYSERLARRADNGREYHVWRAHEALFRADVLGKFTAPPDWPVYTILMSPNKARISVRQIVEKSTREFVESIRAFYEDLKTWDGFERRVRCDFPIRTVYPERHPESGEPDPAFEKLRPVKGLLDAVGLRNLSPAVHIELFEAMLDPKRRIPVALAEAALRRVCAKQDFPGRQGRKRFRPVGTEIAAILRIYLNRELRSPGSALLARWRAFDPNFLEINDMYDENCTHPAYVRGWKLAFAERVQEVAIPGVTASVVKRFFDAAMHSPARVMPTIESNIVHHLNKIASHGKKGLAIYFTKILEDKIDSRLDPKTPLPVTMPSQDQMLFAMGYRHGHTFMRVQAIERKKAKDEAAKKQEEQKKDESSGA